tara:strand:+ start:89 stop:871 length:783 start_codon:yes stop_codon:yes gene_type:complete
MEEKNIIDSNPNMIGLYLEALKQKESSGDYQVLHNPSIITDINTGKPIRVQALGAYGILDINWDVWSKQAGLEGADWHDPKAQDIVARFKVQEYFNKYNSWDLVSIAWFAGSKKADRVMNNGESNLDKTDNTGQSIQEYVNAMNNLIGQELMNIEVPEETFTMPGTVTGPPTPNVIAKQKNMQEVFAAQVLDAMTKANAGGMRPNFESQVPAQAGDFADAVVETKVKRGEIGQTPVNQVSQYAQTVEQAFQQYLDAVNNG